MEKNTETNDETQVNDASSLTLREALEAAMEVTADGSTDRAEQTSGAVGGDVESTPDAGGAAADVQASPEEPALQPPAEYNSEERADFNASTRRQQEAALRLHRSRMGVLNEIKQAKAQYATIERLAQTIQPYIEARGIKEPAEVAIQKAVALWAETQKDPKRSAAAILRAKNIEVPRDLVEERQADPVDTKINPLQERLNQLENRVAQEDHDRAATALRSVWDSFEQSKNAAGAARFPDIQPDKGDSGLQLASKIGILIRGETDESRVFIDRVRRQNPNANYETLLTEAYKWEGGRIDDSAAPNTLSPQRHLLKSNRAASSVPGKGAPTNTGTVRRFATYREAAQAALREIEEG